MGFMTLPMQTILRFCNDNKRAVVVSLFSLCFLLKTLKAGACQHGVLLKLHLFNSYQYFIQIKLEKVQITARPYLRKDLPYGVRLSAYCGQFHRPMRHLES